MNTAALPPVVAVRPLVMLTGFLGAGKTTLLRHTLDALAARQLLADVILNDRESAELDCETLRDHAASVHPLAGSCVCCESLDELCELLLAAERTRHDAIFVELNGTADPLPLLESFTLLESRFLLRPRWQVCVIDCRSFGKRSWYNDLEALQLETASHHHLAHTDELSEADTLRIRQRVAAVNPHATELDAEALAENLAAVSARSRQHAIAPAPRSSRPTPLHPPSPLDARHQLAHEFTGCQILLPEPLSAVRIRAWLTDLPPAVIRAKVLARTTDHPAVRHLFERVGSELGGDPLEVPIRDKVPSTAILIGAELDPAAILGSARHHLGENCSLG